MAAPNPAAKEAVPTQTIPFFSLAVEIRHLIYHQVFSQRTIILLDQLSPSYSCGRRYWNSVLRDSPNFTDATISLLQVCKQVYTEAEPLLPKHPPSHVVLSKYIHELPGRYECKDLERKLGIPTKHITRLTLNAASLGENKDSPNECPGPSEELGINRFSWSSRCGILDQFLVDGPPDDPRRLPNLKGIYKLSSFFSTVFPALREVHLYHVLQHSLNNPPQPCKCHVAGSQSCICGLCVCTCTVWRPFERTDTLSTRDAKQRLGSDLYSRFRAALPGRGSEYDRHYSDYYTLLDLLGHGVHIYLHDEIPIAEATPSQPNRISPNTSWHATYHLSPPPTAKKPLNPPLESPESPRQRQTRKRKEKAAKIASGIPESSLETEILEDFDFDSFLNYTNVRALPTGVVAKRLVEFEAGFTLKVVSGPVFVQSYGRDIHPDRTKSRDGGHSSSWREDRGRLWEWDSRMN